MMFNNVRHPLSIPTLHFHLFLVVVSILLTHSQNYSLLIANNPIVISSNPARRDYVFSLDIVNLIESLIHSNYYPNRLICASSSAFSNLEVFRILSDLLHHSDPYSLLSTTSLVSTPTLIGDSKDFQHLLNSNLVTLPEIDLSMYTLS